MLHGLELEIDADRIEKVFIEGVLGVAEQQARLAHSTVPDDQHLEQVVTVVQLWKEIGVSRLNQER